MGGCGRATCIVHSISAQTSHEGIECNKARETKTLYVGMVFYFTSFDLQYKTLLCSTKPGMVKVSSFLRGSLTFIQLVDVKIASDLS